MAKNKRATWIRSLIEWSIIGLTVVFIYMMGWHTQIIGTAQRAILRTGFFDADTSQIATTYGPVLSDSDYSFAMQTTNGETVLLSDFRGDVVFVNIWASWCPPCVAEMPTIGALYDNVSGNENIHLILLSMDENKQKAADFMEDNDFGMPYFYPASALPNEFRSQYLPATYVISKEGRIVYKKEGIADYSSVNFAQWMRELAQE